MPNRGVVFFAEDDGAVPSLDWLDGLPEKVRDKFIVRIERLAERGHELRRPEAAYLRNGVYELRVRRMNVNYRMLLFFHGQTAVLCHGMTKVKEVPDKEIDRALARHHKFERDPKRHTYRE